MRNNRSPAGHQLLPVLRNVSIPARQTLSSRNKHVLQIVSVDRGNGLVSLLERNAQYVPGIRSGGTSIHDAPFDSLAPFPRETTSPHAFGLDLRRYLREDCGR